MREELLANLVLIGEIPSPTGSEAARVQLLLERFSDAGMESCSADEKGNGVGVLKGSDGRRKILLMAYADTLVSDITDQTVELEKDQVVGPFVGDNSLALAALTCLPTMLERLDIKLQSDVIFMGAALTLGRGNLEGIKFMLTHAPAQINAGLCIESVQLGRLNYICLGMLRGEIVCRLPDDYNWVQFGATGSITSMNDVINCINAISLPRRPLSSIVLGSIQGGISYRNIARETKLCFEVRSESPEILSQIQKRMENIVMEVASQSGLEVTLDFFGRRDPGGMPISHPLVECGRSIISGLGIQPMMYPTTSAMCALVEHGIPSVTLGITTGERARVLDEIDEALAIEPMAAGMAQLVAMLLAIDRGACDGPA